jgi:hypothetical protein
MRTCSLFRSIIVAVTRHPAWMACVLIVGAFSLAPALGPTAMPSYASEDVAYYSELYETSHERLMNGGYYGASEFELELFKEEDAALGRIVKAETSRDRFVALSDYAAAQLKAHESGNLVGGEGFSFEAKAKLYASLAQLDAPEEYSSSSEMPGLNYLSFVFARNSSLFWLLPTVVSCFCISACCKRERLMGMSPSSTMTKAIVGSLAAYILGLVSVALAMLPGFVVTVIANGFGDCAYPVVYIQNGLVMEFTLIETLLRQAALLLLTIGLIVSLTFAIDALLHNPLISSAVAVAMCLVPTIAGYIGISSESEAAQSMLPYLPTTYLSFGSIAGYPSAFPSVDVLSIPGASYGLGVCVVAVSIVTVVCVGCATSIAKHAIGSVLRRGKNA